MRLSRRQLLSDIAAAVVVGALPARLLAETSGRLDLIEQIAARVDVLATGEEHPDASKTVSGRKLDKRFRERAEERDLLALVPRLVRHGYIGMSTEMCSRDQPHVDRYRRGELDARGFELALMRRYGVVRVDYEAPKPRVYYTEAFEARLAESSDVRDGTVTLDEKREEKYELFHEWAEVENRMRADAANAGGPSFLLNCHGAPGEVGSAERDRTMHEAIRRFRREHPGRVILTCGAGHIASGYWGIRTFVDRLTEDGVRMGLVEYVQPGRRLHIPEGPNNLVVRIP